MELLDRVAIGDRTLVIARPAEPDALIDEDAFARDEFLPYWAELWPSGLALARTVAELPLAGRSVLELGCGLGLPSLVASLAGADVLATDWAPEALELLRRNARRNDAALSAAFADWRDATALTGRRFDLVLAADVLYEARNAAPLLAALSRMVAEDGRALVADPGRRHAQSFLDAAEREAWRVTTDSEPLLPRGWIATLVRCF
jgi:predicted nicotinamide N-methyase